MIKLYTIDCPKCKVLEKKLQSKNIEYEKIKDFDTNALFEQGYRTLPLLEIEGKIYTYEQAIEYLKGKV